MLSFFISFNFIDSFLAFSFYLHFKNHEKTTCRWTKLLSRQTDQLQKLSLPIFPSFKNRVSLQMTSHSFSSKRGETINRSKLELVLDSSLHLGPPREARVILSDSWNTKIGYRHWDSETRTNFLSSSRITRLSANGQDGLKGMLEHQSTTLNQIIVSFCKEDSRFGKCCPHLLLVVGTWKSWSWSWLELRAPLLGCWSNEKWGSLEEIHGLK